MGFHSLPSTDTFARALKCLRAALNPRVIACVISCVIAPVALAQTAPLFNSPLPADGVVGVPYRHTFNASGTPPIAFSVTGTLPPGLAFNRMLAACSRYWSPDCMTRRC